MTSAFYERLDESTFLPTTWTRGPWGPDSQHGGPPAALLGRAIERVNERDDMMVARLTFDILRPLPIEPMKVTTHIARPGRNVELIEGSVSVDGNEVMRASAWRIHTEPRDLPATNEVRPPPPPDAGSEVPLFPTNYDGYIQAIEWRFIEGFFLQPGPATAWLRMRRPLVDDEEPSPLTRVLVATDSASGISAALDFGSWLFVNPDLSVYLSRMPEGEWICLQAETSIEAHGVGLAAARIFDGTRSIGRSLQSLFVAPRGP